MLSPLLGDEPGLIVYWKLDEESGQWAYDSSSHDISLRLGSSVNQDSEDPDWVLSDPRRPYWTITLALYKTQTMDIGMLPFQIE